MGRSDDVRRSRRSLIAALSVLLALGGCASGGGRISDSGPVVASAGAATDDQLANRLGAAAPGATVAIASADAWRLGEVDVVVDETYRAASGRDCRRLMTIDNRSLDRVLCRSDRAERWSLGRALSGNAMASTAPGSDELLVPVAAPTGNASKK